MSIMYRQNLVNNIANTVVNNMKATGIPNLIIFFEYSGKYNQKYDVVIDFSSLEWEKLLEEIELLLDKESIKFSKNFADFCVSQSIVENLSINDFFSKKLAIEFSLLSEYGFELDNISFSDYIENELKK